MCTHTHQKPITKVSMKCFILTVAFFNREKTGHVFAVNTVCIGTWLISRYGCWELLNEELIVSSTQTEVTPLRRKSIIAPSIHGTMHGLNSLCSGEQEFAALVHASCQNWSRDFEYSRLHQLHLPKAMKKGLTSTIRLGLNTCVGERGGKAAL